MSTPARTNKGLSYVLGDNNVHENHILPVNALQYSSQYRQLYTAGRDGTIKVWDSDHGRQSGLNHTHTDPPSDYQDIDERLLKLETSISSNPIPCGGGDSTPATYSIVDNYKIHFDWINDLKLVNNDANLVSCSADLSIKLINLKQSPDTDSTTVHKFPNYHTDYIKKLSYNTTHNQVISGGLDGRIIVWDLLTLKPTRHLSNAMAAVNNPTTSSCSIYSLSNNQSNLISTGGSNNSINLFDKRSQNPFIRKLIGHQDNIRCLLMNDSFILSGSSDTSVKLWDLRNFKVYKNFDIHDYPVWSLTSESNDFSVFYSGDKGGNIIKTDLSYLLSHDNTQDFPEFDTFTSTDAANVDEKLGLSTIVAQGDSPILSLCYEDKTIFASNYTSLNRYHVPDITNISKYQYLRTCLDYTINKEIQLSDEFASGMPIDGAPTSNPNEDLNSDFYDIVSHLSVDTNAYDIQSTFSNNANLFNDLDNTNDSDYDGEEQDEDQYLSMFLDINGGASKEFVNMYKQEISDDENNPFDDPRTGTQHTASGHVLTIDTTPVEILLNSIPQSQISLIPYNKAPFSEYQIVPKSIISKRLFSNKRRMLVLYLNGDITIWDILLCKEIKSFPYPVPINQPLAGDSLERRLKEMDTIYQNNQSDETLNNWCDVEIKAGKLLVTIKETSFMNVELYYDDLIKDYPSASLDHPDNQKLKKMDKISVNKDDRFHIGSILLNSFFRQYALFEWEFDIKVREEMRTLTRNNKQLEAAGTEYSGSIRQSNGHNGVDPGSVGSGLRKLKYFGRKSSKTNVSNLSLASAQNSQQASPIVSTNTSINDFAIDSDPVSEFLKFNGDNLKNSAGAPAAYSTSDYDCSVMKLLQSNKKVYWEKYHYPTYNVKSGKPVDTMLRVNHIDPTLGENNEEEISYMPIIQPSRLPPDLLITIFEHSPELGNYRDVCSFHLEDISNIRESSKEEMIKNLRLQLPRWLGLSVLYNKWPERESPKISFQLMECEYHLLEPDQKIGGKSQRKIKKLPVLESSIKLTSHNMLRVSKILYYLSEKFESKTSEMKDKKLVPTDWLAIDCRGQELTNDMTLQTIKTKIWKSSADVELRFRRKYDK
ncbi:WD-40 repeat protein [Suhomyces tanzawaensis NRRL Y-17324]|uniref:WD-40 repeat protein n=1 Tax=Suhomyces tanzawaensis NRRL Y-17324 TaxID=984487 RepID=A0A1E4SFI5_9ASCO|nr:WD-40 repeat protein [Suhomyces tanzawaensis NRRL Y-17324]ODV78268.1 WD-40 repeat protein [Suhomyces tanzawaensis NRRL Y-17324]